MLSSPDKQASTRCLGFKVFRLTHSHKAGMAKEGSRCLGFREAPKQGICNGHFPELRPKMAAGGAPST